MSFAAISTAAGGLRAASARLEQAALRIAVPETAAPETALRGQPGPGQTPGTVASPGVPAGLIAVFESSDITSAVIDAKLAEISFKASAAIIKTADEMFDALLDVTA